MYGFTSPHWRDVLSHLPLWHALTMPQRQASLALPSGYQPMSHAFRHLSAELDAALFDTDVQGRKRPTGALRSLIALVLRLGTWSDGNGVDVLRYVQSTTTHAQRHALTGVRVGSNPYIAAGALGKRIIAGAFGRALSASGTPQEFIRAVGGWTPDAPDFGIAQHTALRQWFEVATRKGDAIYVLEREALIGKGVMVPPEDLLHLALSFGIAMVMRQPDTLLPCFCVIAPTNAPEQNPERIGYKPLSGRDPFTRPFLLDDMETWLRTLKAEPAPVLSDGWNVPLAHQRKIAKGFAVLPPAQKLKPVLEATPLGVHTADHRHDTLTFLGGFENGPFPYAAGTSTLFEWLGATFAALPGECDFTALIRDAVKQANPFLADAEQDAELSGRWSTWETPPEDAYAVMLTAYAGRLASLGALVFAENSSGKGNLSVSLTSVGRWLFGHAETWSIEEPARAMGVVGADFTVSLLGPDPGTRIELAAFAETEAAGFRITRRSIQSGIKRGLTAEAILGTLRALSKHPLPANVVHEIENWAGSRKTVQLHEGIIIEGSAPIVLAEILTTFPKDFAALSPLAIRYLGKGTRAALGKRLVKKGFFPG